MVPEPLKVSCALMPLAPLLRTVRVSVPDPEAPLYAPVPPLMVPGKVATLLLLRSGMVAVMLKPSSRLNEKPKVA